MDNDNRTPLRASLPRAVRKGFIDAYDHLGYVVLVTLSTFALTSVIASMMMYVGRSTGMVNVVKALLMLPAVLAAYLCAVGVYYFVGMVVYREHPVILDTLAGIRQLIRPALKLFAIDLIVMVVLAADFAFFFVMFGSRHNLPAAAVAIMIGYAIIIWLMMAIYHLPLLAAQFILGFGTSVKAVLRKSFLLMGGNSGFTVYLFLVIIAFALLCVVPIFIGIAFLFLGASAFLITHALRELLVRYGIVEEDPEVVEDCWPKG